MVIAIIVLSLIVIFLLINWANYYLISAVLYNHLLEKYDDEVSREEYQKALQRVVSDKEFIEDYRKKLFKIFKFLIVVGAIVGTIALLFYSYSCFIKQIG